MFLLLSSCASPVAFGTETQAEWCRLLLDSAPTASLNDTAETIADVAEIGVVIDTLCQREGG